MSELFINLSWQRSSEDFSYENYNRNHLIQFPGGQFIKASSAPNYYGDADMVNPEESLLAALSSCHMLTVLAIAAKKKLVIEHYEDKAVAIIAANESGKMMVKTITLSPKITFSDNFLDKETIIQLHESAHKHCFIANSLITEKIIQPRY